jgi:hypothetical protein
MLARAGVSGVIKVVWVRHDDGLGKKKKEKAQMIYVACKSEME